MRKSRGEYRNTIAISKFSGGNFLAVNNGSIAALQVLDKANRRVGFDPKVVAGNQWVTLNSTLTAFRATNNKTRVLVEDKSRALFRTFNDFKDNFVVVQN